MVRLTTSFIGAAYAPYSTRLSSGVDTVSADGPDHYSGHVAVRDVGAPIEFAVDPAAWPTGRLRAAAPVEAAVARHVAAALEAARGDRSYRSLARECGLSPQTVVNVARGAGWADILTVARLEAALQVPLWPAR